MSGYDIHLFRQLSVQYRGQTVAGLDAQKVQELLCYLIIHRHRPHSREQLASLLWQNSSTSQAKQYLRQNLWQLQLAIDSKQLLEHPLVSIEADWIQFNVEAQVWIDVYEFESAYALVKGIEGRELDSARASTLREALQLYRGDLLENWYQDWCIFERERLQNLYLAMLDKLVGYCESVQALEDGMTYGTQLLRCDKTHERTYRRLMRLYYLAGDRTGALRQFQRCEKVLQEELGVKPSQRTEYLHRQIQMEQYGDKATPVAAASTPLASVSTALPDLLKRLTQLKYTLAQAQYQVEQEIETLRTALMNRH